MISVYTNFFFQFLEANRKAVATDMWKRDSVFWFPGLTFVGISFPLSSTVAQLTIALEHTSITWRSKFWILLRPHLFFNRRKANVILPFHVTVTFLSPEKGNWGGILPHPIPPPPLNSSRTGAATKIQKSYKARLRIPLSHELMPSYVSALSLTSRILKLWQRNLEGRLYVQKDFHWRMYVCMYVWMYVCMYVISLRHGWVQGFSK